MFMNLFRFVCLFWWLFLFVLIVWNKYNVSYKLYFLKIFLDIVNNLLDFKYDSVWKKIKFLGVEGNNLFIVVEKFVVIVVGILEE